MLSHVKPPQVRTNIIQLLQLISNWMYWCTVFGTENQWTPIQNQFKLQPSHTRRKYVGWCQVSNTATTCPVRRRFASKTSSKLSLPAGVPSTIKRNWLLTKKPETMTRNNENSPGFKGQEAPVWQIHTDSTVFEAEIMESPHSQWRVRHVQLEKHLVLYEKLACIVRRHLLLKGKNERIKNQTGTARCIAGNQDDW